ncbi:sugar transferase [Sedimentisphaera salicampi]|uniref:UDP-glucose:undecaprenyl-phosphate glucose-1-phosphate transferase n=1 Tax=Sedimentisphaera salicampi TaxID=1941349 RepID=A0A1W6LLB4_9BACT|nr:sugar transferase [Sedimentisphaera salicampi]ARN56561.1 UDP-glucose:undecaprenyl-phosphate glucose-1-phosphate transferase [Sedimentisphaera salicampi]
MPPQIVSSIFDSRNGHRWIFWDLLACFFSLFLAMTITPVKTLTFVGLKVSISIVYAVLTTVLIRLCGVSVPGKDFSYSRMELFFATAIGTGLSFLCLQFLGSLCYYQFARTVTATILVFTFVSIFLPRLLAMEFMMVKAVNIALYPSGPNAAALQERLKDATNFNVEAVLCDSRYSGELKDDGIINLQDNSKEDVIKQLKDRGVEMVVLCEIKDLPKKTEKVLMDLPLHGIDILSKGAFVENYFREISLNYANLHWMASHRSLPGNTAIFSAKRIFDFIVASVVLLLSLPFWPLICLIIIFDSKGHPIFKQKRVGLYGKEFTVYKFRTMRNDAESTGAKWASKNDSRITKVGAFLRKTRIDELPQLWNVVKGNMSIVGPRPEVPQFVNELTKQIPYYERRHMVPPGLTGWAQICYRYGASVEDSRRKLEYDLYYIRHLSLLFDIQIIIKTIPSIMKGSR